MQWDLEFVVFGVAVAQGSVRPWAKVSKGKIVAQRLIHGNQAKLMAWRNEIKQAAGKVWGHPLLEGPIQTEMIFVLPRPKYLRPKETKRPRPAKPREYPTKRPDTGKLMRAVEDALTGVVWLDDSQVVDANPRKVYDYDEPPQVKVKVRLLRGPSKPDCPHEMTRDYCSACIPTCDRCGYEVPMSEGVVGACPCAPKKAAKEPPRNL